MQLTNRHLVCTYPAHPSCMKSVTTECPGKKTNHHAKSLEKSHQEQDSNKKPDDADKKRRHEPEKVADDDIVPFVDIEESEQEARSSIMLAFFSLLR